MTRGADRRPELLPEVMGAIGDSSRSSRPAAHCAARHGLGGDLPATATLLAMTAASTALSVWLVRKEMT